MLPDEKIETIMAAEKLAGGKLERKPSRDVFSEETQRSNRNNCGCEVGQR